jgi:hypothetical protein
VVRSVSNWKLYSRNQSLKLLHFRKGKDETWIQVINAIPEFMQLYAQLDQKTLNEVFDSLNLFEGGG